MQLKTRAILGVVSVGAAVGAALIPATNAFAAASMTATWANESAGLNLQNGQTVAVSATGFKASSTAYVVECSGTTGQAACDTGTLQTVQTDANGAFSIAAFPVHTGTVGNGTCNANATCYVAATTDPTGADLTQASAAPIQFDRLQISPRTGLKTGSVLNLSGAGYTANATVYVSECNSTDKATALQHCDAGLVKTFTADANGAFAGTYSATVGISASDPGPYACTAGKTCIVAGTDNLANPGAGNIGGAVVGFAAAPVLKPLAVTAHSNHKHIAKGKTFKISGKATSNGTGVKGLRAILRKASGKSLASTTTGTGGSYVFSHKQKKTTKYIVTIAKQKGYKAATSKVVKVSTP